MAKCKCKSEELLKVDLVSSGGGGGAEQSWSVVEIITYTLNLLLLFYLLHI